MQGISKDKQSIIKKFIESPNKDLTTFLSENKINREFSQEEIEEINKEKIFIEQFKNKQWTANQHYVPQFYLNLFRNPNGRIETLDIKNRRILQPQSTKKICSDTYFYSIETGKADIISQILENLFCYYENNFSEIYDTLVDDILNYKPIEDKILYELCTFVTISRVRGKYFRTQMEEGITEMMKKVSSMTYQMQKSIDPENPKIQKIISDKKLEQTIINGDYDLKTNNSHHIEFISNEEHIRGFSNLLFNKKIRIYISDGERNFVTSDCCIAELVPEKKSFYGTHFMERIHYFVLSPKILIEFSDETKPGKKIKRKKIGKSEVMFYNLIRSMYGKFLYSKSKDDFIEDDYTKARTNYIDLLFDRFPSRFQKDRETMEELKQYSKKIGLHYRDNNELINMATGRKTDN